MTGALRLGIDIGGTKTAVALVAADGTVHALRSAPSGRGPDGVVDVASRLAGEVLADTDRSPRGRVVAIGACMPGLVDPVTGVARHAVNLAVDAVHLADELSARLGAPVAVENDVKAAALGVWRLHALRGAPVPDGAGAGGAGGAGGVGGAGGPGAAPALAYLNLGTGLASAVVRDGAVVRGIGGAAGEIGHLPVGGDVACTCGQVGCLETVASGSALARLWPETARRRRDPFAAARSGDLLAGAAVDVLCAGVGLAVQLLALASGAERVVVGGGLATLGAPLLDGIRADLARRARSSRLVDALGLTDRVELVDPDVPVAALGAAWLDGAHASGMGSAGRRAPADDHAVALVPGERVG